MLRKEVDILYQIQNTSPPSLTEMPSHDPLYNIDLNTRIIETPKEVVVKKDHNSTVFYFLVDRYFDYMDLSTTCCIITYTINNENYAYPVPFYDTYTFDKDNKMVLPWQLDRVVTSRTGEVMFSFKFYKIEGDISENAEMIYQLNTKTASIFVEEGLDAPEISKEYLEELYGGEGDSETEEEAKDEGPLSYLYWLIDSVAKIKQGLAWTILEDEVEQEA